MDSKGLEWRRCSEGFAGLLNPSLTNKRKQVKNAISSKASGPGNIFEKLALQGDEETSQVIAWSSSESDDDTVLHSAATPPTLNRTVKDRPTSKQQLNTANALSKISSVKKKPKLEKAEDVVIELQKSDSEEDVKAQEDLISSPDEKTKDIQCSDAGTEGSLEIRGSSSPPSSSAAASETAAASSTAGVKGSDWIKSLHLKTPKKCEQAAEDKRYEDSGKKKKQPRGGLADQLSRLQARDKSAVRMWGHQHSKSASQETKSLLLEVQSIERLYSIDIVRCVSCDDKDADQLRQGTGHIRVIFPGEQLELLNMTVGTQFRIFPPWQQLALNDDQDILVCTKFCKVTSRSHEQEAGSHVTSETSHVTSVCDTAVSGCVTARWSCPCVQGVSPSPAKCQAYQFPTVPGLIQEPAIVNSLPSRKDSSKGSGNSCRGVKIGSSSSHLHTISSSSVARPGTRLFQTDSSLEESGNAKSFSLLESIQSSRTRDGVANQSSGISFRGYVHRALLYCDKDNSQRCRLLVEDVRGCLCEIQLHKDKLASQGLDLTSCVKRTFNFSGLSVLLRVTRDRDPALFSMVDTVWSGRGYSLDSQDSSQTQDMVKESDVPLPDYCYLLEEESCPNVSVTIEPDDTNMLEAKEDTFTCLHTIKQSTNKVSRYLACVKVVLLHKIKNELKRVLYVTDSSLSGSNNYVTMQVESACYLDNISDGKGGGSVLLRDLYYKNGAFVADGYTQVLPAADVSSRCSELREASISASKAHLVLDSVCLTSTLGQLCTVTGCISDVDEESAYSWDECRYCHSENLQQEDGSVQCCTCDKKMDEPNTRLKMEVIVKCLTPPVLVRVDLLQSTIQHLLPQDDGDEEGYDLNSVLNKQIGPLTGVVRATNVPEYTCVLQEVEMVS